ncbi:MAG TPA: dipeptidase PepE [Pyrinomonadaceae bacterium]|jgi:dipeptidase E|nr:dipeptidase PepE [Pyrinomonadaceae bacterium]
MARRLLLLSNGSELVGRETTEFAHSAARDFLGGRARRAFFVPFASVVRTYDDYAARVREVFAEVAGCEVVSAHEAVDARAAVGTADLIVVGGGNTFHLLREMYRAGLIEAIRERVLSGQAAYIGWSAGSNVACPTIRTTNDMPVVEPPTLDALGLVPFQINPHYTDARLENHNGETRDERLAEFVHANPGVRVVGLREGTMLRIEGDSVRLVGSPPPRLFVKGREPEDITEPEALQSLLR